MRNWLILHVLAACCFGCRAEENVIQPTEDVMVVEGQPTTLTCLFDTTDLSPYLFWYKQQANGNPMFMLREDKFGAGETATEFKERFHARLNVTEKSVPLTIQKVQLSDSAVYYCALRTLGSYKILFGTGTKVIVNSREKHEPSYYTLNSSNTTACLATDFSAHKANSNSEVFNNTEATRVKGDSYYSQVALEKNCTKDGSEKCEANWYFDTDAKINFLSLTILGLRILFLKTIVFNVLMTLRLWMS